MALEIVLGDVIAPDALLEKVVSDTVGCREIMAFIRKIIKTKVSEELERQRRLI